MLILSSHICLLNFLFSQNYWQFCIILRTFRHIKNLYMSCLSESSRLYGNIFIFCLTHTLNLKIMRIKETRKKFESKCISFFNKTVDFFFICLELGDDAFRDCHIYVRYHSVETSCASR